jgi:competence protein ComEC
MDLRSLGHRAPALWLLLPFAVGLAAGHGGISLAPGWSLGLAALALATAILVLPLWVPSFLASVALTGCAYYELTRARLVDWDPLPPREARLVVRIDRMFPTAPHASRWSGLGHVVGADRHLADLVGQRIHLSAARPRQERPPLRSAEVAVVGVLSTLPRSAPTGSFEGYLTSAGINLRLARGRMEREITPPSGYHRFCAAALARFDTILQLGMDRQAELGGVYRAMMLGQKQELSDEQDTLFLQSGTLHLFAISGLHISAIAIAIQFLLAITRLPRSAQFVVALAALWLYVDATGRAPSAVRAFVMMALFNSARLLRVPGNSLAALATAAVVMLMLDPMQLFSAGFQMSYGIVAALLLLGLPLSEEWKRDRSLFRTLPEAAKRRVHRWSNIGWTKILTAVAFGLAATLVGTISGVSFFGLLTPGSFFANLVLIPVSLFVITGGLGALICGLVGLWPLAIVFNHAAVLVLGGIDLALRAWVKVPGTFGTSAFRADWLGAAAFAAMLAVMAWGYAQRWARPAGGYWPPFVLLAILLAVGTTCGK